MRPNLLAIGNFQAPGSTENSYKYAFEQCGWHVDTLEQPAAQAMGPAEFLAAVKTVNPVAVTYTRTHNRTALGPEWSDVWRQCEALGITTASIHLDVFWGIPEREAWIAGGDPLFATGTVFTADGRVTSERAFFEAGVNHVWLPPAIDERNLLPADTRLEPCEGLPPIVWVGSSAYHAEWPWRAELVSFLRREYGDRLVEYGYGSPLGACRENATLTTLYAADTVVVGDSMFAGTRHDPPARYWSDRVPETLGRGGLLLHPSLASAWYSHAHQYVETGCDLETFNAVLRIWSQPSFAEGRLKVKQRAWQCVRTRDTYTHRARTILNHLGLTEEAIA